MEYIDDNSFCLYQEFILYQLYNNRDYIFIISKYNAGNVQYCVIEPNGKNGDFMYKGKVLGVLVAFLYMI